MDEQAQKIDATMQATMQGVSNLEVGMELNAAELLSQSRQLFNPWVPDFLTTKSDAARPSNFRKKAVAAYAERCQVTGFTPAAAAESISSSSSLTPSSSSAPSLRRANDLVIAAHLLPAKCPIPVLQRIGMQPADGKEPIKDVRNAAMLAKGIEEAYDQLQLSFIPDALGDLRLKIWDKSVQSSPIFTGSSTLIGAYDGAKLSYPADKPPFMRVLSFHAYLAYHRAIDRQWIDVGNGDLEPPDFSTPTKSPLRVMRERAKKALELRRAGIMASAAADQESGGGDSEHDDDGVEAPKRLWIEAAADLSS